MNVLAAFTNNVIAAKALLKITIIRFVEKTYYSITVVVNRRFQVGISKVTQKIYINKKSRFDGNNKNKNIVFFSLKKKMSI